MSAYNTLSGSQVPAFTPGVNANPLWTAATVAAGNSSQQYCLHRNHDGLAMSVELSFDGAPGNFQFDLQTADTDTDNAYVTKASVTQAGLNASNYARIEAVNIVARFFRLKCVSLTNVVHTSAAAY